MRTSYFVVGSQSSSPVGLEAALANEAVRFRPRPRWLPPASAPHPIGGLYAAWEVGARWLHRASGVKKGVFDSFIIVVVLNPIGSLSSVILDAVRSFGAGNTLLAIVDNDANHTHDENWYQEAAATAGACGCRATVVAPYHPTARSRR
jgi:hypothetical protein